MIVPRVHTTMLVLYLDTHTCTCGWCTCGWVGDAVQPQTFRVLAGRPAISPPWWLAACTNLPRKADPLLSVQWKHDCQTQWMKILNLAYTFQSIENLGNYIQPKVLHVWGITCAYIHMCYMHDCEVYVCCSPWRRGRLSGVICCRATPPPSPQRAHLAYQSLW